MLPVEFVFENVDVNRLAFRLYERLWKLLRDWLFGYSLRSSFRRYAISLDS